MNRNIACYGPNGRINCKIQTVVFYIVGKGRFGIVFIVVEIQNGFVTSDFILSTDIFSRILSKGKETYENE
jgi:hypothetical protein